MTKHVRILLLTLLLFSLALAQEPARRTVPVASPQSRVETVDFKSELVGKQLPYRVVLPVGYDDVMTRSRKYPVIYLLHGLFGDHTNWTEHTKLVQYASSYDLIVVTPEGENGWYTDSATMPSAKFESYIIKELIPDVQRRFRVLDARESRAIAGLSMGGYGALKFGVKYPQMFTFVGSMSGAHDAASWTEAQLRGFDAIWKSLGPVFGPENSATRSANGLTKLLRELSSEQIAALPFIYVDCGTEDPLFPTNRSFADLLTSKKIPHEFRQKPGGHAWVYWDTQVYEVLRLVNGRLRHMNS